MNTQVILDLLPTANGLHDMRPTTQCTFPLAR
jgi:hypothetical protein